MQYFFYFPYFFLRMMFSPVTPIVTIDTALKFKGLCKQEINVKCRVTTNHLTPYPCPGKPIWRMTFLMLGRINQIIVKINIFPFLTKVVYIHYIRIIQDELNIQRMHIFMIFVVTTKENKNMDEKLAQNNFSAF